MKVVLKKNQVLTMDELVAKLKKLYGWRSCEAMPSGGRIRFTAAGGGTFVMDGNGLAYRVTNSVRCRKADAGESVDLRDDLDLVSLVWAKDEAGNAVAIIE